MREHFSQLLGKTIVHNSEIPSSAVTHAGAHIKGLSEIGCNVVAPHSAKFLFLPDITEKATGAALIVLIVLYVGSQVASTLVATATADKNQRRLMLLLPLVFVVILYRYPAGLLVYWITTNLWTIGQQYLIKRRIGPPPAPARQGRGNGKPSRALKPALAGAGAGRQRRGAAGRRAPPPKLAPQRLAREADERGAGNGKPAAPPPRPPRKKKKRSGRRR